MNSQKSCSCCTQKYCHSCKVVQLIKEKHKNLKHQFGDGYDEEMIRRNEQYFSSDDLAANIEDK